MSFYIYGVVAAVERMEFGGIGIGEKPVHTIGTGTLAFVVSKSDRDEYVADSLNLSEHERVLETVMKQTTILPMRFGTVAENEREMMLMLRKHHHAFRRALAKLEGKVEVEIEVLWRDMKKVFDEIVEANPKLKRLKSSDAPKQRDDVIMAGQMVYQLLQEKKKKEAEGIVRSLKKHALEFQTDSSTADEIIMRGSFLIDKTRLAEFDRALDAVDAKAGALMRFKYFGPMPPYGFTNMRLK